MSSVSCSNNLLSYLFTHSFTHSLTRSLTEPRTVFPSRCRNPLQIPSTFNGSSNGCRGTNTSLVKLSSIIDQESRRLIVETNGTVVVSKYGSWCRVMGEECTATGVESDLERGDFVPSQSGLRVSVILLSHSVSGC